MVRNKTELLQCANAWVAQAKSDIRNQIVNFIQMSGTSEAELANALAISRDELISIIETNNEISLTTFAKLLIATDNVLEIKPLAESPLATAPRGAMPTTNARRATATRPQPQTQPRDSHGRFTSTRQPQTSRGGFPMPPMGGVPCDRNGRPLPPPPGFPMPPMGNEQPQRFGGMPGMQRHFRPTPQPVAETAPVHEEVRPLDELASRSRAELVQMIRDNFWDGEIDVEESTKTQLIEFLISKRTPRTNVANTQRVEQRPIFEDEAPVEETTATDEDPSMASFRAMLDRAVEENPHLRDVIGQYATPQR